MKDMKAEKIHRVNMKLLDFVLVCLRVCVQCRECEEEQVYLTGQVAPLCLKPYLQQAEVFMYIRVRMRGEGQQAGKKKRYSLALNRGIHIYVLITKSTCLYCDKPQKTTTIIIFGQ